MQSARVLTHPAAARMRFRELIELPDERIDLTEASLLIALEQYPSLDLDRYRDQIGLWSGALRQRTGRTGDVGRAIEELNHLLFDEEGFHGDADDYYDPRNAFLNEVLDRHAGLPIALSILYIELSRRIGFPAAGIRLPGRFLVKISGSWGEIVIDPFDGGRVLSTAECQTILDQLYGGAVRLREQHLRAFTRREVVAAMLVHLKAAFLSHHELEAAAAAVDRLLLLDPADAAEIRDRGLLAMEMHRYDEALHFLSAYLQLHPSAEDARTIREQIGYVRAWLEQN